MNCILHILEKTPGLSAVECEDCVVHELKDLDQMEVWPNQRPKATIHAHSLTHTRGSIIVVVQVLAELTRLVE